jgi:transcriptional regulator with XRE-family HTH domain
MRALAARSGVDRRTISALEHGHSSPRLSTAEALARCLEVPVGALFPGLAVAATPPAHTPAVARAATLRDLRRRFTADPSAEEYRVLRARAMHVLDALIAEAEDQ